MIQIKLKYTRQRIEDPNLHIAWSDIVGDVSGNTALQDALNNKQNVGDYATHNDLSTVEDSLQNIINQTKDDINSEIDKKANKSDVYAKEDADSRFQSVGDYVLKSDLPDLGPYAKTIDVDSKISNEATLRSKADQYISGVVTSNKADVERKLAGKLDTTAYTPYNDAQIKQDIAKKADKTYVDSELVKKQDKGDYVDSQTYENQIAELKAQLREVEELINQSGKIDDVYVNGKSVVADKIAYIDMYTKEEIDNMIASASFTVTRDGNTINITSNTSYVNDGTLTMNTSRAREDNNTLYFS